MKEENVNLFHFMTTVLEMGMDKQTDKFHGFAVKLRIWISFFPVSRK